MYVKYPRTPHLPWSLSVSSDDKMLTDLNHFNGKNVIVSIKMDGENTTMYNNGIHARSLDSKSHPSRDWVKGFWSAIKNDIPDGYRICGENLFAQHSISYNDLKSYFYGFSMWDGENCLSWKDTTEWFGLLGINPVTVIYQGQWNEDVIKELSTTLDLTKHEGYVVRNSDTFKYQDFQTNVAKFVRENHVQPDSVHWFQKEVIPNKIIK